MPYLKICAIFYKDRLATLIYDEDENEEEGREGVVALTAYAYATANLTPC
jgi:hypothetical protein